MVTVLVPLAEGCEELEAVTIIDLLRRAKIDVVVAGLTDGPVTASRGVRLLPDTTLERALERTYDAVALPGGKGGMERLNDDERLRARLTEMAGQGRTIAAICAAPVVLANAGLLDGKRATAYPGFLEALQRPGVVGSGAALECDGNIITSRGPGTAMDFALTLIEQLTDKATRDEVEKGLVREAR